MSILTQNKTAANHEPHFPGCPGEKINFNGMIYCVTPDVAVGAPSQCQGLCCDCQNWPHCNWSATDKIFCEHYR